MNAEAFIKLYLNALADTQIFQFAPCISGNYTTTLRLCGITNAEAFIILYLNALADTQIFDLLPAHRAIIPQRFAYVV